jgi:hypothetical protein
MDAETRYYKKEEYADITEGTKELKNANWSTKEVVGYGVGSLQNGVIEDHS